MYGYLSQTTYASAPSLLDPRQCTTPIDLLTSRAFERVARSYERRARSASERASEKLVSGPTTPDQKTMRTTLRKSNSTHSSSSVTHLPLTRTSILFFVRTVPAWTLCLLFPYVLIPLLCFIQVFAIILCSFVFIYLFVFILFIYLAVNVTDRPLPFCSLEAITSIKD